MKASSCHGNSVCPEARSGRMSSLLWSPPLDCLKCMVVAVALKHTGEGLRERSLRSADTAVQTIKLLRSQLTLSQCSCVRAVSSREVLSVVCRPHPAAFLGTALSHVFILLLRLL